jgi:hypothetical protein
MLPSECRPLGRDSCSSSNSGVSSGLSQVPVFPTKRQPAAAPSVSAPASAITVRTTLSALPSMTIARIAMGDVGLTRSAWDGCIVRLTAVGVHQLGAS